jgi:hypothetical protein
MSLCVERSLAIATAIRNCADANNARELWPLSPEKYAVLPQNAVMEPGDSADKFSDLNFLNDGSPFRRHATRYDY